VGVDLGVIHPYAAVAGNGNALVVSGRALRAESYLHLAERKARYAAMASRAPTKGQRGSRRWRKFHRRTRALEARHRRRLSQARHEAAKAVVDFVLAEGAGTLVVGDPAGVLRQQAGAVHNQRLRDWRVGHLKSALAEKAELVGIEVVFVDERGSSSTCPSCRARVPKPSGRRFFCPHCHFVGHRDLVGAVNIASRIPGAGPSLP
jgi:IS605 OrfB family transposase